MANAYRSVTILVTMMIAMASLLAVSGCTGPQGTATPTPTPAPTVSPTAPPTATPAPGNQTLEHQYQYVERFNSGIEHYNAGIGLMKDANATAGAGEYANASETMLLAKDRMDAAAGDFRAMKPYAGSATEISFGEKWAEIAGYRSLGFQNASDAYAEYAYQLTRPAEQRNLVKYNAYVAQANNYAAMASEQVTQAEALQAMIPFMTPTAM